MPDLFVPRTGAPLRETRPIPLKVWLVGFWILHSGIAAITDIALDERRGDLAYDIQAVVTSVLSTGLWAGIFLVAVVLTRARRGIRMGDVIVLLCLTVLLAATRQFLDDALWCAPGSECPSPDVRLKYRLLTLPTTLAIIVNLFAIAWSVRAITLSRENRILRKIARTELLRAQMRTLESHLRPHFLFNALQSTATLMHREPAAARSMLLGIRRLLQRSVEAAERPEVPLREELEVIELYLNVERLRFGARLEIRIDPGPGTLNAAIPPFLLQPLVENAMHHAIALRGEGRIEIASTLDEDGNRLNVVIGDTGAGRVTVPREGGAGVGLRNVTSRLELLYGRNWRLDSRTSEDGSETTISIPYRVLAGDGTEAASPALYPGFAT
jgi:hypothetical protein